MILVVLSVFITVATLNFGQIIKNARINTLKKDLVYMRKALYEFYHDRGRNASSLTELVTVSPYPYLKKIPSDPFTGQADWEVLKTAGAHSAAAWGSRFPENSSDKILDVRSSHPECRDF